MPCADLGDKVAVVVVAVMVRTVAKPQRTSTGNVRWEACKG